MRRNWELTMTQPTITTPPHLWIIGILSLLWHAAGAFDYSATQWRLDGYLSQYTPAQMEYFEAFPSWAVGTWALAVWSSLLGSLALLMRKAWAVHLFVLQLVGLALTTVYNFVLTDAAAVMGGGALVFSSLIWLIAISMLFYAYKMMKRGVLS